MTDKEFFEGVCECLKDVSDIPKEEIKLSDSIINDLEADSLDLLHLIFSLEQHFNITIKPREIERRAKENLGDIPLEIDGVYTKEAIEELKKAMPEVQDHEFKEGLTTGELPRLFKVETFVNLVKRFQRSNMAETVFITGGAGALGAAIVRQFCSEGYQVAFTYKTSKEKALELADETGALAIEADLLIREKATEAVAATIEKYGQIDILINNAGRTQIMPFALIEDEDWDGIMASNLKTMFITTQEAVRGMIHRKKGVIVNVGSLAGHRLLNVPVHYATAKAGVMGFTYSLAREFAPFNIRVNSVVPGLLEDGVGRMVPEKELKEYENYCTTGRIGKMEEVANVIVFAAGNKASYVNGQNIFVDGGI